jgi:hypothetical protein
MIRTPLGWTPLNELSDLFYSQIAPSKYFADAPKAEAGGTEVHIVGPKTIEVRGERIYFVSTHALFAFNALLAVRNARGMNRSEAFTMGMMHHDLDNRDVGNAWHTGASLLIDHINGAAGSELITKAESEHTEANRARYRVSPLLEVVDDRPHDTRSAKYFEQNVTSRLLALEDEHKLKVPYDVLPENVPQILTIHTNQRITVNDKTWVLNDREMSLLNLVRVTHGQPLLGREILAAGFYPRAANDSDRAEGILAATHSLNETVFNTPGANTFVVDSHDPSIVRLARSVSIYDERRLRIPTSFSGNDFRLRDTFRRQLAKYRTAHSERTAAFQYPEVPNARPPSAVHTALGRHAVGAFLENKITMRDLYMISMRLGMPVDILRGTQLPLIDGYRVAYNQYEERIRSEPMSIVDMGKTLGISPTYYKRVFSNTMRRLEAAIA